MSLPNVSQTSNDTSSKSRSNRGCVLLETDSELERFGVETLLERISNMKCDMNYIKLENNLFERYLETNDPEMLLGITKLMKHTSKNTKITFDVVAQESSTGDNDASRKARRSTHSSKSDPDSSSMHTIKTFTSRSFMSSTGNVRGEVRLSTVFRIEMCQKDTETLNTQIANIRQTTKQQLRELTAMTESLRMDRDESIKTIDELHQFVQIKGKQVYGKEIPLEHLLAFVENVIKNGNAIVEQMRLRTATLRANKKQKLQELAIKKELSGILRPIDFEQLQIEKVQLIRQLDENQSQFLGLKRLASNISQMMITQKNHLLKHESHLLKIDSKLDKRRADTNRYYSIQDAVEKEQAQWEESLKKLKLHKATHFVPTIDEYISSKAKLDELNQEFNVLQRKYNISVIQHKSQRSKWARVKKLHEEMARQRAESAAKFQAMKNEVGRA